MTESNHIEALLRLATQAADAGRRSSLAGFRSGIAFDNKSPTRPAESAGPSVDPVTAADIETEQRIREVLVSADSELAFLGEESDGRSAEPGPGLCWVVDPIDGTRAYVCGVPLWSTLIALCDDGEPVLGVVDFPALGERYTGLVGGAARLTRGEQSQPITVRAPRALADALMCCTTPDMFQTPEQRQGFERVHERVAITRFGTDAYGFVSLASGQTDLVIEADLAPWDVAAVAAVVRAAGGIVTDWQGSEALASGEILAASSASLHREALALLSG